MTDSRKKKTGQQVTIGITGMTCASCVGSVEKALKKVKGVSDARINLAAEKAAVDFNPAFATREDLEKAISDAGYTPMKEGPAPTPGKVTLGITGMRSPSA